MIENRLIHYVSFGEKTNKVLSKALESTKNLGVPIKITTFKYSGLVYPNLSWNLVDLKFKSNVTNSRWYKTQLNKVQAKYNLYLDADTVIQSSDVLKIFEILESGFELAIAPSKSQNEDLFWHIDANEKKETLDFLGYSPIQLQAGVFGWSNTIDSIFESWHEEYKTYKDQDQAALIRALAKCDQTPKTYLLSNVFNGGSVVKHNFGEIRTNG